MRREGSRRFIEAALVAASTFAVATAGCDDEEPQDRPASGGKGATAEERAPEAPSGSHSIWTRAVPREAPLDPRSDRLVASLNEIVERGYAERRPAWIAINQCSTRIFTVPADQPSVRVTLTDAGAEYKRTLQAAFDEVPLPSEAQPSDCPDRTIVVVQPSRDRMWELWHARRDASGWQAEWGGATQRASKNPGSYGPRDWPGAQYNWGASGSSMTMLGGVIRLEEVRRGLIDHAITLQLPDVAAGVWSWPAQRTDGTLEGPDAIPYGAHFRLDPALDVDSLDVPAATKVIARAVQHYGFVVRERTGFTVQLPAEAPPPDGPNPWPELLKATPDEILRAFPWRRLELLKMDLRSRPGPPSP